MAWKKKGLIYETKGDRDWEFSHAHVVSVDQIDPKKLRLIFSVRNAQNQCLPTFLDVDALTLEPLAGITKTPLFNLGSPGTFDDCGIMPTYLLKEGSRRFLYYIGWTVRNTIPYHNSLGLSVSEDGINYKKLYSGPILAASNTEPFFVGSACVKMINSQYVMWYLSCNGWERLNGRMEPVYDIKIATSQDAIHWYKSGETAIELRSNEGGISRPTVLYEDEIYKMWYSYRGKTNYRKLSESSYRIGYAESKDGFNWDRKDDFAGITVSDYGWDTDMIEYPFVFKLNGKKIMIYNGNGFGKSGFGYAIWRDE